MSGLSGRKMCVGPGGDGFETTAAGRGTADEMVGMGEDPASPPTPWGCCARGMKIIGGLTPGMPGSILIGSPPPPPPLLLTVGLAGEKLEETEDVGEPPLSVDGVYMWTSSWAPNWTWRDGGSEGAPPGGTCCWCFGV
jgi:hypothetical protein